MAEETFAICISESAPSCIRAPPDATNRITGSFRSPARSNRRASFSPTTTPMLPPMNSKSITPIATGRFSILPRPTTTASLRPVLARDCSIRFG